MKTFIKSLLLLCLSLTLLNSCKDVLNVSPANIIQDETIFSSESGIEAYMATLYNDLPIEDFNFSARNGFNTWASATFIAHLSDEAIANQTDNQNSIGDGTWLNWLAYPQVRNVNNFIDKIQGAGFPSEQTNQWLGEARFIRAYYYFGMVKRYGGIPLITTVQNYTGDNIPELQVPRNTEKEVYDFIASELEEAAKLLKETSDKGRANKFVAYALKSRAMVYAASEAKYGSISLNGLIGIPVTNATGYWQAAYDAAKLVVNGGKYTLYAKQPDKVSNFTNLFLDGDNPEAILVKQFAYPQKTHSYDLWNLPYEVRSADGYSSRTDPTVEMAETFEYVDGTDGAFKLNDAQGNPIKYAKALDLFTNKDPRFFATLIVPFSDWKGTEIDIQAGIIANGQTIKSGDYNMLYQGLHIIGANGLGGGSEVTQTGFYVRKYLNPAYDRSIVKGNTSAQAYIDLRLAEVLLNYAEAAVELGKVTDATVALNQIRSRAGIQTLTDAGVTLDKVRHERRVELAFESHRYWDIRRWHIADKLLNNTTMTALEPYYTLPDKVYIFKKAPAGYPKTFFSKLYYERIDPNELSKNPKLIQNPNY